MGRAVRVRIMGIVSNGQRSMTEDAPDRSRLAPKGGCRPSVPAGGLGGGAGSLPLDSELVLTDLTLKFWNFFSE